MFATCILKKSGLRLGELVKIIEDAYWRLLNVKIENLDFERLIEVYDSKETVFYLDPPYYKCKHYCFNFDDEAFERLKRVLTGLKGKFLMSINDHPDMRALLGDFNIEEIESLYSIGRAQASRHRYNQLLVSNYERVSE